VFDLHIITYIDPRCIFTSQKTYPLTSNEIMIDIKQVIKVTKKTLDPLSKNFNSFILKNQTRFKSLVLTKARAFDNYIQSLNFKNTKVISLELINFESGEEILKFLKRFKRIQKLSLLKN